MQESVQYIAWQLARTQGILVVIVGHLGNFQFFLLLLNNTAMKFKIFFFLFL